MNHNTKNPSKIKTLGAALIAVCALQNTAAVAETITHRVEVPMQMSNWTHSLSVPRFDAALGTLVELQVAIAGSTEIGTWIENGCEGACTTTSGAAVNFGLMFDQGGIQASMAGAVCYTNHLGAFDGTLDWGGASGASNAPERSDVHEQIVLGTSDFALAEFVGTGDVGFTVQANAEGHCEGAGDFWFFVQSFAGAAVEVRYTYVPAVVAADEMPPVVEVQTLGSIANRVWEDSDRDGFQDRKEEGLKGWTVELWSGTKLVTTAKTDKKGDCEFIQVPTGTYRLRVCAKDEFCATGGKGSVGAVAEALVELQAGNPSAQASFGFSKRERKNDCGEDGRRNGDDRKQGNKVGDRNDGRCNGGR